MTLHPFHQKADTNINLLCIFNYMYRPSYIKYHNISQLMILIRSCRIDPNVSPPVTEGTWAIVKSSDMPPLPQEQSSQPKHYNLKATNLPVRLRPENLQLLNNRTNNLRLKSRKTRKTSQTSGLWDSFHRPLSEVSTLKTALMHQSRS